MLGKTLNLEILAYRKIQDKLFGYDFQTWLEIIFIDAQNIISHIMFKSESLDNFDELVLELFDKKVAIACGTVTAQMQPRVEPRVPAIMTWNLLGSPNPKTALMKLKLLLKLSTTKL